MKAVSFDGGFAIIFAEYGEPHDTSQYTFNKQVVIFDNNGQQLAVVSLGEYIGTGAGITDMDFDPISGNIFVLSSNNFENPDSSVSGTISLHEVSTNGQLLETTELFTFDDVNIPNTVTALENGELLFTDHAPGSFTIGGSLSQVAYILPTDSSSSELLEIDLPLGSVFKFESGFIVAGPFTPERPPPPDSGGFSVQISKYSANGVQIGDPIIITYGDQQIELVQDILELSDGSFLMAWSSFNSPTINYQRYSSEGDPIGDVLAPGNPGTSSFTFDGASFVLLNDVEYLVHSAPHLGTTGRPFLDPFEIANQLNVLEIFSIDPSITPSSDIILNDKDNALSTTGLNDVVFAFGGDDTVNALGGNDRIDGGAGADTIDGGAGNDIIIGGRQNDFIDGGEGNDIILGGLGADTLVGGMGHDLILGGNRDDQLFGEEGDDRAFGGNGNDTVDGGDGADILRGGSQDDVLTGGVDNDVVFGGTGRDNLSGGDGNDLLFGRGGFDALNGGAGDDILEGGVQADQFIFEGAFGNDTITDFAATNNAERINLSAVDTITDFQDLVDNHISQVDANVLIDDGLGNSITLLGVTLSDLDAADFVF